MAVSGAQGSQIKPTDPLFVHQSNNHEIPLVVNILNGKIFDNWKRCVIIALEAKHTVAFISGNCSHPDSSSTTLPLLQRNNAMLFSWLLNSLCKNIKNNIVHFKAKQTLYNDLAERIGQPIEAILF